MNFSIENERRQHTGVPSSMHSGNGKAGRPRLARAGKFALALLATIALCAPEAFAQSEPDDAPPPPADSVIADHLRCYRIKDPSRYAANADLFTNSLQRDLFPDTPDCKIIVKAKEFCIPVAKERKLGPGDPRDAPHVDVEGQFLTNDFLCYVARCADEDFPDSQRVVDQFGERDVSLRKTVRLCTPAFKVPLGPDPSGETEHR